MKKVILAVSEGHSVTDRELKECDTYAHEKGWNLVGTQVYPLGAPILIPDVLIESIKSTDAEVIINGDPAFVLGEIINDEKISKSLKGKHIEVYIENFDMEINELINAIPRDQLNLLKQRADGLAALQMDMGTSSRNDMKLRIII